MLDGTTVSTDCVAIQELSAGEYNYTLVVGSSDGSTDSDDVSITILAEANTPPIADAGSDQTFTVEHDGEPNTTS